MLRTSLFVSVDVDYWGEAVHTVGRPAPEQRLLEILMPPTTPRSASATQPRIAGDLIGGVVASIMSLPEAMAYGVLVFSAMHPQYAAQGLLAGLIAMVMANVGSALIRGVPIMSSSPFSLVTLMIAAEIPRIRGYLYPNGTDAPDAVLVFSVVFLSLFLAGALQILFGILRLGQLVKFVPQPVVAGLFNGTALIILMGQMQPMLGLAEDGRWSEIKWLTLGVGLVTAAVAWGGHRVLPRVPPVISAMTLGVLLYHGLLWLGYGEHLGPMIGEIPIGFPLPTAMLPLLEVGGEILVHLPTILTFSAALAITASMGTLTGAIAADEVLGQRTDANKELVGQGVGNVCSALFGGIMSAGSPSRTIANFQYGGHTRRSRIVIGLFALAVILVLGPVVEKLPLVVLAGLLVALAIGLFDTSTLRDLRQSWSADRATAEVARPNLGISLTVTILLMTIGILKAVGVGLLLSVAYFIFRMGSQIVRCQHSGQDKHSRVQRNEREFSTLEEHGDLIQVLELEGSLFFGTADQLAVVIAALMSHGARWILIDFNHVADLDSTGIKILRQSAQRCANGGVRMAFAVRANSVVAAMMASQGLTEEHTGIPQLHTLNDALDWAEEELLAERFGVDRYAKPYALADVDAFAGLSADDLALLTSCFTRQTFADEGLIFEQGQSRRTLFVVLQGRVRVSVSPSTAGDDVTLTTLCPGRLLGELAFLDGRSRSGRATAQGEVVCLTLDPEQLQTIRETSPHLVTHVWYAIGREVSFKLRIANKTTRPREDGLHAARGGPTHPLSVASGAPRHGTRPDSGVRGSDVLGRKG